MVKGTGSSPAPSSPPAPVLCFPVVPGPVFDGRSVPGRYRCPGSVSSLFLRTRRDRPGRRRSVYRVVFDPTGLRGDYPSERFQGRTFTVETSTCVNRTGTVET